MQDDISFDMYFIKKILLLYMMSRTLKTDLNVSKILISTVGLRRHSNGGSPF